MTKKKNIPMRMCIACREMKPKQEMTRVVKSADGDIRLDVTGKAPGRGAYICNGEECLKKLQTKKLLNRAFSADVSADVYKGVGEENVGKK
jgi:predicted RNA-binding protein YlxR (DUF448 family)